MNKYVYNHLYRAIVTSEVKFVGVPHDGTPYVDGTKAHVRPSDFRELRKDGYLPLDSMFMNERAELVKVYYVNHDNLYHVVTGSGVYSYTSPKEALKCAIDLPYSAQVYFRGKLVVTNRQVKNALKSEKLFTKHLKSLRKTRA